jgi:hypothetical protein
MTRNRFLASFSALALALVAPVLAKRKRSFSHRLQAPASIMTAFVGRREGRHLRQAMASMRGMLYRPAWEMINGPPQRRHDVNVMAFGAVPYRASRAGSAGADRPQPGHPLKTSYQHTPRSSSLRPAGIRSATSSAVARNRLPRGTSAESYVRWVLAQNGIKASRVTCCTSSPQRRVGAAPSGDRAGDLDQGTDARPRASGTHPNRTVGGCDGCYDPALCSQPGDIRPRLTTPAAVPAGVAEAHQWVRQHLTKRRRSSLVGSRVISTS